MNRHYLEKFSALLNYATLPFYWGSFEPEEGKPNTARLEKMARTARAAGLDLKGHPLIWHEVPCKWWPDDIAMFEKIAEARIHRDVRHFMGLIDRWDVVNEAVVAPKFENSEGRWIKELGAAEAVARALKWARAANPKAQLIVNDFWVEDEFAELLRQVRQRGGDFDAIGLQSHMHKGVWPLEKAWTVCERFKEFDVPLHFPELTVLSGALKTDDDWHAHRNDWLSTPEGEIEQADYVEKFYTLLFSHPSVTAITWWDFADGHTWQGAPAGLVKADMSPKPVYTRLIKLIKSKWWTTTTISVGTDGRAKVRGFLGDYHATLKFPDGHKVEKTFRVGRGMQNQVIIEL